MFGLMSICKCFALGLTLHFRRLQEQFSGPTALPPIFQRTLVLLSQQACGDSGLFVRDADVRKVSLLRQAWDRGQDPLRMVAVSDCCAVSRHQLLLRSLWPANTAVFERLCRAELCCILLSITY